MSGGKDIKMSQFLHHPAHTTLFQYHPAPSGSSICICCVLALQYGTGLVIDMSRVQIRAAMLSRNIRQLSLASLLGRYIKYMLRLGVKARFTPLSGGR